MCSYQGSFYSVFSVAANHSTAAAAASLQLCPTLCDPTDGSPPGSPVPGILQARTLEWVAISFSNACKWKVKVKSRSHIWLLATHGLQPTRLLRPWDFPGKSTRVGCHCLRWITVLISNKNISHGQRILVGYSPWGCRVGHEWATEHTANTHTHARVCTISNKGNSRTNWKPVVSTGALSAHALHTVLHVPSPGQSLLSGDGGLESRQLWSNSLELLQDVNTPKEWRLWK